MIAAAALVALAIALHGGDDEERRGLRLDGRVIDAAGKPVDGVELATGWHAAGSTTLAATAPLRSDRDGRFHGEVRGFGEPFAVVAYDRRRSHAAVLLGGNGETRHDVELRLQPVVVVSARVTAGAADRPAAWVRASFTRRGERVPIVSVDSETGALRVPLPAGAYDFELLDRDLVSHRGSFLAPQEARRHDLGSIDLAPSYLLRQVGQVLPEWHVTEARGLAQNQTSLSALRGRWLLVEFWGFW